MNSQKICCFLFRKCRKKVSFLERDFLKKNTEKLSSDKRSRIFWSAIQSDGRKLLVKCRNKLNSVGYSEILKNNEEKMHL